MNKIAWIAALVLAVGLIGLGPVSARAAINSPMNHPAITAPNSTSTMNADKTLDRYWTFEKARLSLIRNHDKEVLSIYEKDKGDTKAARTEVNAVDRKYIEQFKALDDQYPEFTKPQKTAKSEVNKIKAQREEYLNSHPEVATEITSLRNEVQELKARIAAQEHRGMKPATKPMKSNSGY